jgi:predicted kinase
MNSPLLLVVTGSPASGKSTLARLLAHKINCPLIARGELKEGLINTLNLAHNQLDRSVDLHVYDTFFEAIELLISKKISIVVEAAFQDKLWKPKLLSLLQQATIKIIICKTDPALLKARFANRLSDNPDREKFHGDESLHAEQLASMIDNYQPVKMEVPTLQVDTKHSYDPAIEEIINFIRL